MLFSPFELGQLELPNRIVMSPMTRSRAVGNVANELMARYYAMRADAGLIITEGTSPSPNGLGYARIPGLFSAEQVKGWKRVTQAVHDRGGRIFVQLMHTGRVSHPLNMPAGARILAPSALAAPGTMRTDQSGPQPHPVPESMSAEDIAGAIREYALAATLGMEAGFDGVELHGANGYLIEQFLNPVSNQRSDDYGGSAGNRMRFLLDAASAVAKAIGGTRTAIRLSPYGASNGMAPYDGIEDVYGEICRKLSATNLLYVHVVDHSSLGAPAVSDEVKRTIRENFKGAYLLSGGYTFERAEHDLAADRGDLVVFGRPFIANPDLVERLRAGAELKKPDPATFYTAGPEGYV